MDKLTDLFLVAIFIGEWVLFLHEFLSLYLITSFTNSLLLAHIIDESHPASRVALRLRQDVLYNCAVLKTK